MSAREELSSVGGATRKSSAASSSRRSSRGSKPLECNILDPPESHGAVNASDYEKVTMDTQHMGSVKMRNLTFSNRQMVRSQHKTDRDGVLFLVTNRTSWSLYYVLLRMNSKMFWGTVALVEATMVLVAFLFFLAILQPKGNALLLALDVAALAVGDVECDPEPLGDSTWACRTIAAAFSLLNLVLSLFLGGVIVVRLSRVVAKHRFEFASSAILRDGELLIRLVSNRPSMIIMPSFRLEYFDTEGRATPLHLMNGGSIAFLHDAALLLRHDVRNGPFDDPNWRNVVQKVRVSIMGFDELLAQDVCGCALYHTCDIKDDARYGDIMLKGEIEVAKGDVRDAIISDSNKMNTLVYDDGTVEEEDDENDRNIGISGRLRSVCCPNRTRGITFSAADAMEAAHVAKEPDDLESNRKSAPREAEKSRPALKRESSVYSEALRQLNNVKIVKNGVERDSVVFPLSQCGYTTRVEIRALMNTTTTHDGMILCTLNRRQAIPWHYLFLRMTPRDFWKTIFVVSVFVTACGALAFFVVGRQTFANAVLLSLDANGLSVGDVVCFRRDYPDKMGGAANWPCFVVGAVARLVTFICELFFGAIIIVRLSRVVVKNRFEFADFCVLDTEAGELIIRIVSNRPSTIIMPTFVLEYLDARGKKIIPLKLTNGGTVAYLTDSSFFLRHKVDAKSPFSSPHWRKNVIGIRIAVVGFDELLAQEACGCRLYSEKDIKTDVVFGRMVNTGKVKFKSVVHAAYVVDMLKLNASLPKESDAPFRDHYEPSEQDGKNIASVVQEDAVLISTMKERQDEKDDGALDIGDLGLPSIRGPLSSDQKYGQRTSQRRHSEPVLPPGPSDDEEVPREKSNDVDVDDAGNKSSLDSPLPQVSLGVLQPNVEDEPLAPRPLRAAYAPR